MYKSKIYRLFDEKTTLDNFVGFVNYEFEYYGEPTLNENNVKVRPLRKFKTTNGEIVDPNEMNQIVSDIRYHYNEWRKMELNKILKNLELQLVLD